MNIHLVTIAYGLPDDSRILFNAAVSQKHDVFWHVFQHSTYPDVTQVCYEFATSNPRVKLHQYGFNRGVAKSWNEGVLNAYDAGADVVIVSNDDIVPREGDLDLLAETAFAHPNAFMTTCFGFDRGLKKETSMRYGFWAWHKRALEVIGMMDENFFPMYWEDVDYDRRAKLAGLDIAHCAETYVIHQGSKSIYTVPNLIHQHHITLARNETYYFKKWSGVRDGEIYTHPFNDERVGLRIAPEDRAAPYPEYNRADFDVVTM